ncbi:nucleotide disphospho-sugar-binding domain-containing protein [Micromonospora sp. NPDC050397]|uniref:nucleotide disphospho-sugar-binding domain-containing protein n=1 Tax=Micromonospora sp. NPDC050397 TaxID=3364279 RepID=UPI00384CC9F9
MLTGSTILIAAWAVGGNAVAYEFVARKLVAAGARVVVLGNEPMRVRAGQAGAEFLPYERAPHETAAPPGRDAPGSWQNAGVSDTARALSEQLLFGPAHLFLADVSAAIEKFRPHLVIADHVLLGALLAAERAGIPHVVCVTTVYPLPTGAPNRAGDIGSGPYRILYQRMLDKGLGRFNQIRQDHGLTPTSTVSGQYGRADRCMVLSYRCFDPAASSVPDRVVYVGAPVELPRWPLVDTAARDANLVIGLSTLADPSGSAQLDRLLAAVGGLAARVFVLGEVDAATRTIPPNVTLTGFVQPSDLFARATGVVTQGGHGTVLRALAHGVPILGIPSMIDQYENVRRAVSLGAAIEARWDAPADELRDRLRNLLTDDAYRVHARRVAEALRREHDENAIVDLAVEVLDRRSASS